MSDDMPAALMTRPTIIVIADYGHGNFEARIKGGPTGYGSGHTRSQAVRSLACLYPGMFCVADAVNKANLDEQFGDKVLADPGRYNVIIDDRIDPALQ